MHVLSTASGPAPRPAAPLASVERTPICLSGPPGAPLLVQRQADRLLVCDGHGRLLTSWRLALEAAGISLHWLGPCAGELATGCLLAALEAAFILAPQQAEMPVHPAPHDPALLRQGVLQALPGGGHAALRGLFFQHAPHWLAGTGNYPLQWQQGPHGRHPLRAPKPRGVQYRRHIAWLGQTLSLRALEPAADLPLFHRWMNDPVVDHFWQEAGDLAQHQAYLQRLHADPHTLPLMVALDGVDFAYVEAYWAKEDRIAPFCEAADHDRGWHVLVGEPAYRGRSLLSAWMPSVAHYLFLDDARTERIVIEPRSDNARMLRSLSRSGYELVKQFDFPHKRATLGVLTRERYFRDALWLPQPASALTSKDEHAHT